MIDNLGPGSQSLSVLEETQNHLQRGFYLSCRGFSCRGYLFRLRAEGASSVAILQWEGVWYVAGCCRPGEKLE